MMSLQCFIGKPGSEATIPFNGEWTVENSDSGFLHSGRCIHEDRKNIVLNSQSGWDEDGEYHVVAMPATFL